VKVKFLLNVASSFWKVRTTRLGKRALLVMKKRLSQTNIDTMGKNSSQTTEIKLLKDQVRNLGQKNIDLLNKNSSQTTEIELLKDQVETRTERNDTDYRIDAAHRQLDRVNGAIAAATNGSYVAITIQAVIISVVTATVAIAVPATKNIFNSLGSNPGGLAEFALTWSLPMIAVLFAPFLFFLGRVLFVTPGAMGDVGGPFPSLSYSDKTVFANTMNHEKPEDLEKRLNEEIFMRERVGKAKGQKVRQSSQGLIWQIVILAIQVVLFAVFANAANAFHKPF